MGRETASATSLAPGFRFHPTDEELVSYYLKRKVCGKPFRFNAISEVDIYKSEPWELPCKSRLKSRDQEWYFFSALDRKYGNGARMNRATGKGYWKATGKDRTVRHANRTFGMKKTLVFHSGRAPDGKRTDWVMHEYRLVDEELEKAEATQEAYVLCRVFQKSGLGPPNGSRYAPFIEEEWEDDATTLVPGEEPLEETVPGDDAYVEANDVQQDTQSVEEAPHSSNELPKETQNLLPVCKSERLDDCPELCVVNREAPFPIIQYKRRRQNELDSNHSNGSDNSTRSTHDHNTSSTTTTAATAVTTTVTTTTTTTTRTNNNTANLPSPLLELSLLASVEAKENSYNNNNNSSIQVPEAAAAAAAGTEVGNYNVNVNNVGLPSCCMKYINKLQNEIHKGSIERETMKLEMMSAQAMINILQSQMESLSNENADLRRCIQGGA